MKTKDMKSGISLIVLIITIIVIIILAAVVILTLSKNNPIESAKEARFKEDVRTFQDELALYISKQYTNAGGHWDGNISATNCDDIVQYIPSFTKKYEGKFIINNNNLEYTNKLDEKEKEYAKKLNVKKRESILPNEYQQVDYIESIGGQYFDTKYIATKNTNTEYKIKSNIYKKWGPHILSSPGCFFPFYRTDDNKVVVSIAGETQKIDFQMMAGEIYEIKYWNGIVSINGIEKGACVPGNTDITSSLYLLTYMGDPEYSMEGRLYFCKIYNLDEMVRNFIPCYSTTTVTDVNGKEWPSGTKGLYDTVEGKFYTNQGTGEFIAGPEVD